MLVKYHEIPFGSQNGTWTSQPKSQCFGGWITKIKNSDTPFCNQTWQWKINEQMICFPVHPFSRWCFHKQRHLYILFGHISSGFSPWEFPMIVPSDVRGSWMRRGGPDRNVPKEPGNGILAYGNTMNYSWNIANKADKWWLVDDYKGLYYPIYGEYTLW